MIFPAAVIKPAGVDPLDLYEAELPTRRRMAAAEGRRARSLDFGAFEQGIAELDRRQQDLWIRAERNVGRPGFQSCGHDDPPHSTSTCRRAVLANRRYTRVVG